MTVRKLIERRAEIKRLALDHFKIPQGWLTIICIGTIEDDEHIKTSYWVVYDYQNIKTQCPPVMPQAVGHIIVHEMRAGEQAVIKDGLSEIPESVWKQCVERLGSLVITSGDLFL